jgi:BclB C-terminal domain-containing protein
MTTASDGTANEGALISFGSVANSVSVVGGTVDLTGSVGQPIDEAWVQPRSGTMTSLSVMYSNVVPVSLSPGSAVINVALYTAISGSNTFASTGTSVNMPLSGSLVLGTTEVANTGAISIPIIAGNRYLLVASITTTGISGSTSLTGYISAGINII